MCLACRGFMHVKIIKIGVFGERTEPCNIFDCFCPILLNIPTRGEFRLRRTLLSKKRDASYATVDVSARQAKRKRGNRLKCLLRFSPSLWASGSPRILAYRAIKSERPIEPIWSENYKIVSYFFFFLELILLYDGALCFFFFFIFLSINFSKRNHTVSFKKVIIKFETASSFSA